MVFRKVLFLGAHTDDEFGCVGTLLRLVEEGVELRVMHLSACEESVPVGFDRSVLREESQNAMKELGISSQNHQVHHFSVRKFPDVRQEILELFVKAREFAPDLVLLPSTTDIHQDHQVVSREGLRAFKHCTIWGYELPQNTVSFAHACFVKLERRHIDGKIRCLANYRSQATRPYANPDFIESLARVRGVQSGAEFAEAFEVIRQVY